MYRYLIAKVAEQEDEAEERTKEITMAVWRYIYTQGSLFLATLVKLLAVYCKRNP